MWSTETSLREKCPNTEFFRVRIFLHYSDLSVFSPNAGKHGPEKTPYLDNFHAVYEIEVVDCGSYQKQVQQGVLMRYPEIKLRMKLIRPRFSKQQI